MRWSFRLVRFIRNSTGLEFADIAGVSNLLVAVIAVVVSLWVFDRQAKQDRSNSAAFDRATNIQKNLVTSSNKLLADVNSSQEAANATLQANVNYLKDLERTLGALQKVEIATQKVLSDSRTLSSEEQKRLIKSKRWPEKFDRRFE